MPVDYTFTQQYSLLPESTGSTSAFTYHSQSWDAGRKKFYSTLTTGVVSYNIDTEVVTTEGLPSGATLGSGAACAYDSVNDVLFVANTANPGVIYKLNAASLTAAPLGSHTVATGAILSMAYSPTSNVLAVIAPFGTLRLINASTMLQITSVAVGGALHVQYSPPNNEFFTYPTQRFVSVSGSITGTLVTTGIAGTLSSVNYNSSTQRFYQVNSNSPFNFYVINPATRSTELNRTNLPLINSPQGIFYFSSIKKICIVSAADVVFYDPETEEFSRVSNSLFINPRCTLGEDSTLKLRPVSGDQIRRINLSSFSSLLVSNSSISGAANLSGSLSTDRVYFPSNNNAQINAVINFFELDAWLSMAASNATTYLFSWTRSENTAAVCGSNLAFNGAAQITGDFQVTMGVNTVVTLGSRSTYTENILIPSTGKIVANRDVNLSAFNLSSGVTFDNSTSSPITITINESISFNIASPTLGGGAITVVQPQIFLRFEGLIEGSEAVVRLTGSPTVLFKQRASVSGVLDYVYDYPGYIQRVDIDINLEGYQTHKERNFALRETSQFLTIQQVLSTAWRAPV